MKFHRFWLFAFCSVTLSACGMSDRANSWEKAKELALGVESGLEIGRAENFNASASLVCSKGGSVHLLIVGKFISGDGGPAPQTDEFAVEFLGKEPTRIEMSGTIYKLGDRYAVYSKAVGEGVTLAIVSGTGPAGSSPWIVSGVRETRLKIRTEAPPREVQAFDESCRKQS